MTVRVPSLRAGEKICVSLGCETADELARQAEVQARSGETFLEFCLEELGQPQLGPAVIQSIRRRYPRCQILVTYREATRREGALALRERLTVLEQALAAGACAFDLEIESAHQARAWFMTERPGVCRILSWHNDQDANGIDDAIAGLRAFPADIYKVVCAAHKLTDNLLLLHRDFSKLAAPVVRFAMHPAGQISRILSLATGSPFTYAAPSSAHGTAPGQLTVEELRACYQVDRPAGIWRVFAALASSSRVAAQFCRSYNASPDRPVDAIHVPCVPSDPADFLAFAARLPLYGFSVHGELKTSFPRWMAQYDESARSAGRLDAVIGTPASLCGFVAASPDGKSEDEQNEGLLGIVRATPQQDLFYARVAGAPRTVASSALFV